MRRIAILLTIIILTLPMWGKAQIKKGGELYNCLYSDSEYKASNQNFGAIKDKRGIMYFANA
ncbi:MAG: hypothetical protein J5595_02465, partial [Bacteroidales bacterium]|nr:hypothetical protein [Bacteroidales bacterium]